MENNRKSLLDNLGQEAQAFLDEGRQPTKKEKEEEKEEEKKKKSDSSDDSLGQVSITVRIPRNLYDALADASFYSKRKRIREFDTQQAIVIHALTSWLKENGYLK